MPTTIIRNEKKVCKNNDFMGKNLFYQQFSYWTRVLEEPNRNRSLSDCSAEKLHTNILNICAYKIVLFYYLPWY